MKIVIIGTGKMAEAMMASLSKKMEVEIAGRDIKKCEELSLKYSAKVATPLDEGLDISGKNVILAVKPYALGSVSTKLSGEANSLICVLAGTKIDELKSSIKAKHYVRAMPNLSATFGRSMTTLTGDESFREEAELVCRSFGRVLWLGSEKEIDIATAVAGSGPAFLALVAEALGDGAVKEGLKRDDAMALVRGLFDGFAPLLDSEHPAIIKDGVMSPGGTTAAGFSALEEGAVRDGFIKAVERAYEKAKGE